ILGSARDDNADGERGGNEGAGERVRAVDEACEGERSVGIGEDEGEERAGGVRVTAGAVRVVRDAGAARGGSEDTTLEDEAEHAIEEDEGVDDEEAEAEEGNDEEAETHAVDLLAVEEIAFGVHDRARNSANAVCALVPPSSPLMAPDVPSPT
ncbi:MAG TPA: hypothetical protein V6C97_19905, partial [Oculatellaceae cyanobacterium]